MDDATNGILLSNSIHNGYHKRYSDAIRDALDRIPLNLSIDETMARVYDLQSRAAYAFANGATLKGPKRLDTPTWIGILTQ